MAERTAARTFALSLAVAYLLAACGEKPGQAAQVPSVPPSPAGISTSDARPTPTEVTLTVTPTAEPTAVPILIPTAESKLSESASSKPETIKTPEKSFETSQVYSGTLQGGGGIVLYILEGGNIAVGGIKKNVSCTDGTTDLLRLDTGWSQKFGGSFDPQIFRFTPLPIHRADGSITSYSLEGSLLPDSIIRGVYFLNSIVLRRDGPMCTVGNIPFEAKLQGKGIDMFIQQYRNIRSYSGYGDLQPSDIIRNYKLLGTGNTSWKFP